MTERGEAASSSVARRPAQDTSPEVTSNGRAEPERGAESLDGAPVELAVFCEFREVVDKSGVNHAIRHGCPAAQAFEVFQITAMNLSAGGDKRLAPASERARPST